MIPPVYVGFCTKHFLLFARSLTKNSGWELSLGMVVSCVALQDVENNAVSHCREEQAGVSPSQCVVTWVQNTLLNPVWNAQRLN